MSTTDTTAEGFVALRQPTYAAPLRPGSPPAASSDSNSLVESFVLRPCRMTILTRRDDHDVD
jgi:hypothetical protein